jgi:hypothetical protein
VLDGILKIWRGEHSLFRAFWLYFYLCNNFVAAVAALLIQPLQLFHLLWAGKLFVLAVWAAYFVIASVGVWRSAATYPGPRIWAALARLFSALGAGLAILGMATLVPAII